MRIFHSLSIPFLLTLVLPLWLICMIHPCWSIKVPNGLYHASSFRKVRKRRGSSKVPSSVSRNSGSRLLGGDDKSQRKNYNDVLTSELIKEMRKNNDLYGNTLGSNDNHKEDRNLRTGKNSATVKKKEIDNWNTRRKQLEEEGNEEEKVLDCVIIGAGWSGIAAAMRLQAEGDETSIKNVKIFEARNYIGGRSQTKEVVSSNGRSSYPIDMGSQWIEGDDGNPMTTIMQQNNISYTTDVGDMLVFEENNGGVIDDIIHNNWELYYELYDGFHEYQQSLQRTTNKDQSLATVANTYRRKNGITKDKEKDRYLQFALDVEIEQYYAASLNDLSLLWWNADDSKRFSGRDVIPINGYQPVINAYASRQVKSQIMLNTRVSKIDYSEDDFSDADPTAPITIEYYEENEDVKKIIRTKNVIITVPLGVLKETNNKESKITFKPPLPSRKQQAISQLGMGLLNKIIMVWKKRDVFWPEDIQWYGDVVNTTFTNGENAQPQYKFEFFTPYSMNGGRPFMVGLLSAGDAWQLERKYDRNDTINYQDEMTREAMKSLRNMFGSCIPEPEKVIVSRWGTDPYSLGSYSFNKVGMGVNYNARSNLAQPIELKSGGGLYFAGEATSSDYFGTTHGAFLSGREAAEKLIANTNDDKIQARKEDSSSSNSSSDSSSDSSSTSSSTTAEDPIITQIPTSYQSSPLASTPFSLLEGEESTSSAEIENPTFTQSPASVSTSLPTSTGRAFCFSKYTTVMTKEGNIQMDQLQLGDMILTATGQYEPIYSFGHLSSKIVTEFLQFLPSGLEISPNHLIFLNQDNSNGGKKKYNRVPVPAAMVKVGDVLYQDGGVNIAVTAVKKVQRLGVYAPFTPSGTLIVNGGITVSNYISYSTSTPFLFPSSKFPLKLSYHTLAHTYTFFHRFYCRWITYCRSETYNSEGISTWVETGHRLAMRLHGIF